MRNYLQKFFRSAFIDVYHEDQKSHQFIWSVYEPGVSLKMKRYSLKVDSELDAVFLTHLNKTRIYEFYQWDEIKDAIASTLEGGDI